jgi:hypothetical protein
VGFVGPPSAAMTTVLADTVYNKPIMFLSMNPFRLRDRKPGYYCVRAGADVVAVRYSGLGGYHCPLCDDRVKICTLVQHYDVAHPSVSHRYRAKEIDWMWGYRLRDECICSLAK